MICWVFSYRFCQTCNPPTSKKFLCIVFRHLGDFWNFCSRSFGLSKLRKTMSTLRDSLKSNFEVCGYCNPDTCKHDLWLSSGQLSGGRFDFFLSSPKKCRVLGVSVSNNPPATACLPRRQWVGPGLQSWVKPRMGRRCEFTSRTEPPGCWIMLKRPSLWMIMCGILIYPMFFKIRFMQICGNNHTSVLEKRVCQ